MTYAERRPAEIEQSDGSTAPDEQPVLYASMPELARELSAIEQRQRDEEIRRSLAEARCGPNELVYRNTIGYVALHEQLRIAL
jgi:hypothetical protein